MYLKRKQTSEVIKTQDGVSHPDAVVCVSAYENSLANKKLNIEARAYHTRGAYLEGAQNISLGSVNFIFTEAVRVPNLEAGAEVVAALQSNADDKYEVLKKLDLGNSGYDGVIDGSIELGKTITFKTPQAKLWVMEQKDMFGIPFRENWDLYDEDDNLFDYEGTLLAVLTA